MAALQLKKQYKKYPSYKDSGVDWLGKIPSEWKIDIIQHLFSKTKRTGFQNEELLSVYRDKGVIIKSSRDDNHNQASEDLSTYQLVRKGDLAINKMKAWQGSVAISNYQGIVSPAYYVCKPLTKNNPRFLHYLLRSDVYIKQYERNSGGVRNDQWDLKYERFRKLEALIPLREEQGKIADFLDEKIGMIDEIIERKKRQIELLQERRTAIINKAVTRGLDPKAELIDSEIEWIGKINKKFKLEKLKYHVKYQEGPGIMADDFHEEGVPLVRISGLIGDFVECNGENYLDPVKVESRWKQFKLNAGDLLISASASTDVISEVKENSKAVGAIAYTGIIRLISKNEKVISKDYLKYFISSKIYKEQIELSINGTAMQHYGPSHLGRFLILISEIQEQEKIITNLDKITEIIDQACLKNRNSIGLLEEFKGSLISNVVTGKVRV